MQWGHSRSKYCSRYLTSLGRRGRQGRGKVSSLLFAKLAATKKNCELSSFYKIGWNEEKLDCPGALPLQQLAERAALPTEARIRKASEHVWPQIRTGGEGGWWPRCFANILSTESIKQGSLLSIWLRVLKTHIVAVHYKDGRWSDRLKSQCL